MSMHTQQAQALALVNRREQRDTIMRVVNGHADSIEHLMQGLEKMFYELQKRDFQIEALLDGVAQLTKRVEGLEAEAKVSADGVHV